MTKFYRFIRFLVSLVIKPLYPVKVFGQRKLDEKKTLLAINHLSNLDPVLAGCYLKPQLHFWAKRELFKNKFFGSVLRKLGAVPINRGEADISFFKAESS